MINIPNQNPQQNFPKVVKQSDPVETAMYKAIFTRFVTFGFHVDDYKKEQEGITVENFYTLFGFELFEDMAGNPIKDFEKEFDNGTIEKGPRVLTREYPLKDKLHERANSYKIAMALDPTIPTVRYGKGDRAANYIENMEWEPLLGKTVLLQVEKRKSKTGNFYNQIKAVMPLGMPADARSDIVFFNIYDPAHKEVFDTKVHGWEKKKIRESLVINGEPQVIYREAKEEVAPNIPMAPAKEDAPQQPVVDMDFDDDIPF